MTSIYLNALGLVCALGNNKIEAASNLFAGNSPGLIKTDRYSQGVPRYVGEVYADLPMLPNMALEFQSKNNKLLALAANQITAEIDDMLSTRATTRVAIVLGTSTSGMREGEQAIQSLLSQGDFPAHYHLAQQELGSPAHFLSEYLHLHCPNWVISTACTSSTKALATGARLLTAGMFDLVLAGGVDTLCKFTIAGFNALESLSIERCQPFSKNRQGINIGEGAALFLMSTLPSAVALVGWGESSDGYHISAPDPRAIGPRLAVQQALTKAEISADQLDYVNLHGTATQQNDAMEAKLVQQIFPDVPVSSTKPLTGHCLGAAGAIDAAIAWLTLTEQAFYPPHIWDQARDEMLPNLNFVKPGQSGLANIVMSNNFAFGGNNTSLIFKRIDV